MVCANCTQLTAGLRSFCLLLEPGLRVHLKKPPSAHHFLAAASFVHFFFFCSLHPSCKSLDLSSFLRTCCFQHDLLIFPSALGYCGVMAARPINPFCSLFGHWLPRFSFDLHPSIQPCIILFSRSLSPPSHYISKTNGLLLSLVLSIL